MNPNANSNTSKLSVFYQIALILVILVSFFYFRIAEINRPIWEDEKITLKTLQVSVLKNPLFFGVTTNLPLFYYSIRTLSVFNNIAPYLYRTVPLLFNFMTLIFLSFYIRKRFSVSMAIIFGFIFALAPIQVYYSTELRAYSMAQFLLAVQVVCLYELVLGTKKYLIPFVLFTILSLATHYCAYIFLIAELLIIVGYFVRTGKPDKTTFITFVFLVFVAVIFFVLMLKAPGFSSSKDSMKLGEFSLKNMAKVISVKSPERLKETVTFYYWFGLYYFQADVWIQFLVKKIVFILGVLGAYFLYKRKYGEPERFILFSGTVLAISLLVSLTGEHLGLYPFGGRHIMPYSFLLYIFISYTFYRLLQKSKLTVILLLVFLATLKIFTYCSTLNIPKTEQGNIVQLCIQKF